MNGANQYLAWRSFLRQSSAVICPSRSLAQRIREVYELDRVFWVPNPVSGSVLAQEVHYGATERAVSFVGRLVYEKGAHLLPEIARRLPDVKIQVIGSGPLESFLRKSAQRYPNLAVHGYLTTRKTELLRESVALLMPSVCREAFPYSMLEAFALGKPVVGFALGGVQELVEDSGGGMTVQAYDLKALSDKISEVVDDPHLAMTLGRAGREYVQELTPHKYAKDLAEIYALARESRVVHERPSLV